MTRRFAAVVGLLVLGAIAGGCNGGSGDGPLGAGNLHYGQALDVGEDMSLGTILLRVEKGNKPATIDRVRVVGATGGMEFLEVRSRRFPNPTGNFLADFGFPPEEFTDTQSMAENNVVPATDRRTQAGTPLDGLMLVIGLRTTKAGIAAAKGVEVRYRVGSHRYTETFDQHVFICAPLAEYKDGEGCPPESAKHDFGKRVLG